MKEYIFITLVYILLGLGWSDFMRYMISKTGIEVNWDTSKKIANVLLWPISFIAFLYGLISQIINLLKNK